MKKALLIAALLATTSLLAGCVVSPGYYADRSMSSRRRPASNTRATRRSPAISGSAVTGRGPAIATNGFPAVGMPRVPATAGRRPAGSAMVGAGVSTKVAGNTTAARRMASRDWRPRRVSSARTTTARRRSIGRSAMATPVWPATCRRRAVKSSAGCRRAWSSAICANPPRCPGARRRVSSVTSAARRIRGGIVVPVAAVRTVTAEM